MKDDDLINLAETEKFDYGQWFNFFSKIKARRLLENEDFLMENLPSEGYAAFRRWQDVFENPVQMEKIAKSRMEGKQNNGKMDLAISDDDEAFYEAEVRDLVAQRSDKNISPQEYSRLSALIMKARDNLKEIRSRKPKKGSTLTNVLDAAKKNREKIAKKQITSQKIQKTVKNKSSNVKTTPLKRSGTNKVKKVNANTFKNGKIN